MAIRDVQWLTKDKITALKLSYMSQDAVNSTDNIHPQYWKYLGNLQAGSKRLTGTTNALQFYQYFRYSEINLGWSATLGSADGFAMALSMQFFKGITPAIDVGARHRATIATGINSSDIIFRISAYKFTAAAPDTKTLIVNGAEQYFNDSSFHEYIKSFDISTAAATDLIRIDYEIKTNNVYSQAGRIGEGIFFNPYYTRKDA